MRVSIGLSVATVALVAGTMAMAPAHADEERGPSIALSLGTTYDTNRLRLDEGIAPPPGGSEDDLITEASATLDLSYKIGLQRLFLGGTAGYSWHRDNTFLDNEVIDLTGGIDWGLTSRCDGVLSVQVVRRQTDLADLEAVVDNTRETETYLGTGGCAIGAGWRAELEAEREESDNSSAAQRLDDLEATRIGGTLSYRPNQNQLFGVRYALTEIDYPNITAPGGDAGVDITVVEAVARRNVGASLKIDAALGYSEADTQSAGAVADFDGTTGRLELTWRPSRRLSVDTGVDRAVAYSSDVSADYFVRDRTHVGVRAALNDLIEAEVSARHIERDFMGDTAARTFTRTYDETDAVRGAVHYMLRDRLKLSAGVEFRDRETNGLTGDYDATRYFISLGVTP